MAETAASTGEASTLFRSARRAAGRRLARLTRELVRGRDPYSREILDERLRELAEGDRRWREHLLQGVRGLAPLMAVDIDGTLYFFDTADAKSSRRLFVQRGVRRDHATLRQAVDLLRDVNESERLDLFLDVGAHIGTTTLFAIRHLGFAGAVAIEASLENMRILRLSVVGNGLERVVRTVHAAVSDHEGSTSIDVSGVSSEYHHIASGSGGGLRQLVETTTLDRLVEDGVIEPERASLVWMDIEGYEWHALSAGTKLLERGTPLVLELCSEKIRAAGTLERVSEILGAHYTHAVDLRKPREEAAFFPIREIPALIEAYEGHCVDALICRRQTAA